MVLIKNFLAVAAVVASSAVAVDLPNTDIEAAAFWGQLETLPIPEIPVVADVVGAVIEGRGDNRNRKDYDDGRGNGRNDRDSYDNRGKGSAASNNNRDDYGRRPAPRPPRTANPYQDRKCPRNTKPEFPRKLTCERNNCFRSFLSTRDDDRHCPSEAFGFCCLWLSAGDFGKKWAVKNDWIFKKAPYTRGCSERRDKPQDVIRRLDDVCGCTIKQKVTVEVDTDYFKLRGKKAGHPTCKKQRRY